MKQVLFFTYYYPPSGGSGVQRALKFTKYLPEFGWMPTVITVRPEHAAYPDLDPDLAHEIPDDVRIERTSAWDPYALYATLLQQEKQDIISVGFLGEAEINARQRLARWVRANIFLPDARVGWVPFAAARGHRLLRERSYDAVVTTGPPHSTHLAGLVLRLVHKKPWIADFRDPWTEIDYYAELPITTAARALDRWLERTVVSNASTVVVRSVTMGRQLLSSAATTLKVIENGFDPVDFNNPPPELSKEGFTISHVGNLNMARNPGSLWVALGRARAHESMPDLRLRFVGNVEPAVLKAVSDAGLSDLLELHPYVPHDKAIAMVRGSTLLLLPINRVEGSVGIVPGKLYEYVASGRPVLGIGPTDGDAARVLAEAGAGQMFDFDDVAGIETYVRANYRAWRRHRPVRGATWDRALPYSRKEQTRQLARELDAVAATE